MFDLSVTGSTRGGCGGFTYESVYTPECYVQPLS